MPRGEKHTYATPVTAEVPGSTAQLVLNPVQFLVGRDPVGALGFVKEAIATMPASAPRDYALDAIDEALDWLEDASAIDHTNNDGRGTE